MMLSVTPGPKREGLINYLIIANKISNARVSHKVLGLLSIFNSSFYLQTTRVLGL